MSSIEKFLGKPKKIEIDGQEIEVWPLQFDDTDLIVKLGERDPNLRSSATKELLRRSLKKTFPEATDEQITQFGLKFLNEFMNAIFEASGLEIDKKKLESMMAP